MKVVVVGGGFAGFAAAIALQERRHEVVLLEEEPVVGGETFDEVANAVIEALLSSPHDTMTVLTGADAPVIDDLLEGVAARHPEVEVDVQPGGQPHYHLLIAAE